MTGLVAEELTVRFGDVVAVDQVSLRIDERGCSGLIGPNGSGKTSFINAISGFVPAHGSVRLGDRAIKLGHPRAAVAAGIARTFQTPQTFANLTCRENVLLGTALEGGCGVIGAWLLRPRMHRQERKRIERAEELLDKVGMSSRSATLAGQLSYGEQRRLELARALATRPTVILLDEPTAGLNEQETDEFAGLIEQLRDDGLGFFLVEHKLEFVSRLCHSLAVLALGRVIAQGPPGEVLQDRAVMDAYLGVRGRA
jgi:branched-chain amino acid transport system ATP-binding protein